ncbi:MAG: hypothetical protein R3E64_00605 [Halioglobus sp.]
MTIAFDRILIAVPELSLAIEQYQKLFATDPYQLDREDCGPAAWWGLHNTVIALVERPAEPPRLAGVVFSSAIAGSDDTPVSNVLGIDIALCNAAATSDFRQRIAQAQCAGWSVDHVVLRTDNAQACIELFTEQLGIRLALDKTAPQWGGRMLFFRAGKLTLEVIQSDNDATTGSFFWGLAYKCENLADRLQQLHLRGVAVSDIRDGRKPGTLVATVKSHCLNIPTLLIQGAT